MPYEWKDKVVLITGAATGIGALVVRIILDEGVKHVAVLDIAETAGIALQTELNVKHGENKLKFYKCDVANEEQLLGCFKAVVDEQEYLDVVVNNAGIMNDSLDKYKKQIQVNVTALVTGTLKAMELMGKNKSGKGGAVINISSVAALIQSPIIPIYSGTKSAVLQFSNCIGMEEYYSKTGVRVLAICFGGTDTPLLSSEKLGSFDEEMGALQHQSIHEGFYVQKPESAAQGVVDAYKLGDSGSTWLAACDRPAKDITESVQKAYALLTELFE